MLKAAIFDMDGLLVDSEPFWQRAQVEVFSSLGVTISQQETLETMGLRIDHIVDLWFERQPWQGPSCQDVNTMITKRVEELVQEHKPMLPGVREAIQTCQDMGLTIALASSSPMSLINATLDALSLTEHFSALFSAEHLRYGKPHPEVYLNAAHDLGVDPLHCVAFEDSLNGLLAVKAARMKSIVVPQQQHSADLRWSIADKKLNSLLEVNKALIASL